MSSEEWVHLNGTLVGRDRARVSALDRGFLYGDGFFETMRVLSGRSLFIERHLARLAGACRDGGFGTWPGAADLAARCDELIGANDVTDGYLRLTVSRGALAGSLADLQAEEPTVLVCARPMELPGPGALPEVVLARSGYRVNEHSPTVGYKSLSYQANVLALSEARREGADEVYFLNGAGRLAECATSNLFFVRDGCVCTPADDCGLLPGIARSLALEICSAVGIPFRLGRFDEDDVAFADEVFCTNSLRGVMAVRAFAHWPERRLGERPVTVRLNRAYWRRALAYCEGGDEGDGSTSNRR